MTAEILEKVKEHIAPLPSQGWYMKSLAGLLAMHINRNLLIDDGYAAHLLRTQTADHQIIQQTDKTGNTLLNNNRNHQNDQRTVKRARANKF